MLTAEERPSSGSIKINGIDIDEIHTNPELMKNMIGYCPQTNPIWDFLTVFETLYLYA
jgi:ABC-type multidrug transport system ATPase subunit